MINPTTATIINIVCACISSLGCIGTIITTSINIRKNERQFFSTKQNELFQKRESLMNLRMNNNYDAEYLARYSEYEHNYLNKLDEICKLFPQKWIIDSDIKTDLQVVKATMSDKLEHRPSIQKLLQKCEF